MGSLSERMGLCTRASSITTKCTGSGVSFSRQAIFTRGTFETGSSMGLGITCITLTCPSTKETLKTIYRMGRARRSGQTGQFMREVFMMGRSMGLASSNGVTARSLKVISLRITSMGKANTHGLIRGIIEGNGKTT